MIWVVDGHEVEVLVSAKGDVEVLEWNEHKRIIQVPVRMRNAEAIWTVRSLLQVRLQNTLVNAEERLEVFDKHWPIKLFINKKTSYMENGIIHCYAKNSRMSPAERIRVREELLQQFILRHVGQWEETLDLLIPCITFRRNGKKPYIIQRSKERICFDKGLYMLSSEAVAYCVFNAVANYGVLDEIMRRKLMEKHFPIWKTLEKITFYAYPTHINR